MTAQELKGTVVQADSVTPASGAVVLLLHATRDSILTRTVTGERGMFSVTAPGTGIVRLRVLRLGYQPTNVGEFTLSAGQSQTVRVVLGDKRVVLATLDVRTGSRCDVRPNSALLVAQLYEEARKALLASASPVSGVKSLAQFTLYTRQQDLRGKLTGPVQRTSFTGPSSRPFASLSADSLAKVGYVVDEKDGTVYRAPDAEVLLAESFLRGHCLQFVQGTGERAASVGIGFRPVNRQRGFIDVRGTLWLDRESSELQSLEYSYEGLPANYESVNVGGRVEYTQMAAGLWFVNKWSIRMPRFSAQRTAQLPGAQSTNAPVSVDLAGLQIIGGEVQAVRVDDELLYENRGASLAGSEPGDFLGAGVTAGSFAVAVDAQKAAANATPAAIDSAFSVSACTDVETPDYAGKVQGRVRDANSRKTDSIPVAAEWKEEFKVNGQKDFSWQFRRIETRTMTNGTYVLCGLPLYRAVTLTATNAGRKSRVATVQFSQKAARTSMDLSIGLDIGAAMSVADAHGRGALLIVTGANGEPLPYVALSLNGGLTRVTDVDGRVIVNTAPRDSLRLLARRIGYTAFDGKVARDSANGAFRLTMVPVQQSLAQVNVRGRVDRSIIARTGFYDRVQEIQRGASTGEFFTPEQIEARPSAKISQFLQAARGISWQYGKLGSIAKGRGDCAITWVLDGQRLAGVASRLDGQGAPGDLPVDDLISFNEVMAVEVYPIVSNAPAAIASKVGSEGLKCGVIAVWTGSRR